jgi:hypothetical protein
MNMKRPPINAPQMEQKKDSDTWIDNASELVENYRKLISIRVIEHTSQGISISIVGILVLVVAVFVLLFTGLGSAWWLGERLNNMKAGFFIIGGLYLLMLLIIIATSRKVWIPHIRNLIIKIIYEQD